MRATSGALVVSGYLSRSYAWDVACASSFTDSHSFTEFSARGVLAYLDFFFPTEFLIQCDGCWEWGWVWRAGLVAGLWLGQAFGVFLLPGFGVGSSSPQIPRHPTSMCDAGVNVVEISQTLYCAAENVLLISVKKSRILILISHLFNKRTFRNTIDYNPPSLFFSLVAIWPPTSQVWSPVKHFSR